MQIINELFKNSSIPQDAISILQDFDVLIQKTRPLNSRQIQQLPENIKNLSHLLTDNRSERRLGYMNDKIQLNSYVRYYTWWNLVRLTKLFSNLPDESFPQNDCVCLDLGTGPLTVICALYLAKPNLRNLKLSWYCLDVSSNSMIFGEDIFMSIVAKIQQNNENFENWKIIRVKGSFGTHINQKADFITCANMFNELDQSSSMPPEFRVKKYFSQLMNYSTQSELSKFLLIEPGIPKAARTISLFRERFLKSDFSILSPCPHSNDCPMNGFKAYTGSQNKWCNFAFSTEDAPQKLQKLSIKAKLPKERATLSFISVKKSQKTNKTENSQQNKENNDLFCRINSDSFFLPHQKTGFYACSKMGLTLVETSKNNVEILHSGDLLKTKTPNKILNDKKTGAVIVGI